MRTRDDVKMQLEDCRGAAGGCNVRIENNRILTKGRKRGVKNWEKTREISFFFPSTNPLSAGCETVSL